MHIASATTRTGYVARGIAGKEAASCVHSHQTAASDILFGVHFYDHVACGIASGQGGTRIRLTWTPAAATNTSNRGSTTILQRPPGRNSGPARNICSGRWPSRHASRNTTAPMRSCGSAAATPRRRRSRFSAARPTKTCNGASTTNAARPTRCTPGRSTGHSPQATAMRPGC